MEGRATSGLLTFVFTDIEGSTALWERELEAMATALERHDLIVRETMEAWRGRLFGSAGDGFCVAFTSAADAVAGAVRLQRALANEPWPVPASIRVRLGLHSGEAIERRGDYFGPVVNLAARVMSAAGGGEILMSLATLELVRQGLPHDCGVRALGEQTLRGIARPEPLFALVGPGLVEPGPTPHRHRVVRFRSRSRRSSPGTM